MSRIHRPLTAAEWMLGVISTALSALLVAATIALSTLPAQLRSMQTDLSWIKASLSGYYTTTQADEVHKRIEQKDAEQDHAIQQMSHRMDVLEDRSHGR